MARAAPFTPLLSQWLERMLPSARRGALSSAAHAAPPPWECPASLHAHATQTFAFARLSLTIRAVGIPVTDGHSMCGTTHNKKRGPSRNAWHGTPRGRQRRAWSLTWPRPGAGWPPAHPSWAPAACSCPPPPGAPRTRSPSAAAPGRLRPCTCSMHCAPADALLCLVSE